MKNDILRRKNSSKNSPKPPLKINSTFTQPKNLDISRNLLRRSYGNSAREQKHVDGAAQRRKRKRRSS